jgi:hypothetical protein
MDTAIPTKIAMKFAFKTGIEFEYLYAEALEAMWRAETDGTYDPYKSAFTTYANTCVWRHLSSVVWAYRAQQRWIFDGEPSETMPDPNPDPERVAFFFQLLRQLPADAVVVTDLALNVLDGIPPYKARTAIRNMLRPGWSQARIDRAFNSVTVMLTEARSFAWCLPRY